MAEKSEETKPAATTESTETSAPKFDIDLLINTAEEMNDIMGLVPPIDINLDDNALFEKVHHEAEQILIEDQKSMTPEAWDFLNLHQMLGHLTPPAKKADKPAKEKKEKAEKPAKEKKEKTPKDPNAPKKGPRDFSTSNKARVFSAWNKGAGETDVEKLAKIVEDEVKISTIKAWIQQWKSGKNLPASAK